ncbi:MAG: hypothetical protein AAF533_21870 [Acidobacteriota bacterium]
MIPHGILWETDQVHAPEVGADWEPAGQRSELKRYFALAGQRKASVAAGAGAGATAAAAASSAPSTNDPFAICQNHPRLEATYNCTQCGTGWCNDCIVKKPVPGPGQQQRYLLTCSSCEGSLREREKERIVTPFYKEIGKVLTFPLSIGGIAAIAVISILKSGGAIAYFGGLLISLALMSYWILIIRHTSDGERNLPNLGLINDYISDLVWPGVKAALVVVIAFLPATLYSTVVAPEASVEAMLKDKMDDAAIESMYGTAGDEGTDEIVFSDDSELNDELEDAFGALDEMGGEWADDEGDDWGSEEEEVPDWASEWALEEEEYSYSFPWFSFFMASLLQLYGYVMIPAFLIVLAVQNSIMPALMPATVFKILNLIKTEYILLVVLCLGLEILLGIVSIALLLFTVLVWLPGDMSSFIIGPMLSTPFFAYVRLVQCHAIGRVGDQIGAKIDW